MQACSQGIIVSKDQFKTIASKEIYVLLHLILMLCLICVNTCWSYQRVVSVNLVLVLSVRLLFLHSFKGPFNRYLIYFTFVKSVAINKNLSQPLRAKAVRISETKHDQSNPITSKVRFMLIQGKTTK